MPIATSLILVDSFGGNLDPLLYMKFVQIGFKIFYHIFPLRSLNPGLLNIKDKKFLEQTNLVAV